MRRSLLEMTMVVLIIGVVLGAMVIVVLMETGGSRGRGVWTGVVTTFLGIAEGWVVVVENLVVLSP